MPAAGLVRRAPQTNGITEKEPEANCYICPAGKKLVEFRRDYATPRTGVETDRTRR
jgi:hypothetical protein